MTKYVSLGLSCQSRMTIDAACGKQSRLPFDYCITEKPALIKALETLGGSFVHNPETSSVYSMSRDRREGVRSAGVYFWHDYPMADTLHLREDWMDHVEVVNEKYRFLWRRFSELISSSEHLVFVVSSTQSNLRQFSSNDVEFQKQFAIDRQFVDELRKTLGHHRGDDVELFAMVGSLAEADSLRSGPDLTGTYIRYFGSMGLPTHPSVAYSFLSLTCSAPSDAFDRLEGHYDNGAKIVRASNDAARVYRLNGADWVPWAEAYATRSGYLFAFSAGRNAVFTASLTDRCLKFSNGTAWSKS